MSPDTEGMTPPPPRARPAGMVSAETSLGGYLAVRLTSLGWAIASTGLAAVCLVLFVLAVVSFPLTVVWAGIPLLIGVVAAVKPIATLHRRMAGSLLERDIAAPYLKPGKGNVLIRWRGLLGDRAIWRDLAWVAVNSTAGLAISIVGIVEGVLDLVFWWLPPGMMMRVHAVVAAALLSPTDKTTLAQRVQQLAETQAETRDTSAAELRRIERDLHDGAQARLVSLGLNLGMVEEQWADDPEAARKLLAEARESSSTALAELRDLVRGIHPPVLADRGLVGAVRALCLTAAIPIEVRAWTEDRFPAPVESAAYFAVAEGVGNVMKHSGAASATVTIERSPGVLRLCVIDRGAGGADPSHGTGLRGIERRLAAFDGTMTVSSPDGGPTELTMMIPL